MGLGTILRALCGRRVKNKLKSKSSIGIRYYSEGGILREKWGKLTTQQTLAGELGKSQVWVTQHLAIAKLDKSIKEKLFIMNITEYIVWNYLLPLSDTQKQILSGEK